MMVLKPFPNCDIPIGRGLALVTQRPRKAKEERNELKEILMPTFVVIVNVFPLGCWGSRKIDTEILLTSTHWKLMKKATSERPVLWPTQNKRLSIHARKYQRAKLSGKA